jgi:hypothetical protein
LELNTLKKLNGDKLGLPFLSIVLAKAIGLGATALCKYPWSCAGDSVCGSKLSMFFLFSQKYNFYLFLERPKRSELAKEWFGHSCCPFSCFSFQSLLNTNNKYWLGEVIRAKEVSVWLFSNFGSFVYIYKKFHNAVFRKKKLYPLDYHYGIICHCGFNIVEHIHFFSNLQKRRTFKNGKLVQADNTTKEENVMKMLSDLIN